MEVSTDSQYIGQYWIQIGRDVGYNGKITFHYETPIPGYATGEYYLSLSFVDNEGREVGEASAFIGIS